MRIISLALQRLLQRGSLKIPSIILSPTAIFIALMLASIFAMEQVHTYTYHQSQQYLATSARAIATELEQELQSDATSLQSVRAFFQAQSPVTRSAFLLFIQQAQLHELFPSVLRYSYLPRVSGDAAQTTTKQVRTDTSVDPAGYPSFDIYPHNPGEESWPIVYVSPEERYVGLLGSNARRSVDQWEYLEYARDHDTFGISPLARLADNHDGFRIGLPLYRPGATIATIDDRRNAVTAYINLVIHADQLFTPIVEINPNALGLTVTITDARDDTPVYAIDRTGEARLGFLASLIRNPGITSTPLTIANQTWNVQVKGTSGFGLSPITQAAPLITIFMGLIVSTIVALTISSIRLRMRAQLLIRENASLHDRYDFLSIISHQLRTPINSVRWNLDAMQEKIADKDMLRTMFAKIDSLNSILTNLLYFQELANPQRAVDEPERIVLIPLLREHISIQQHAADAKHITVTLDSPRTDLVITAVRRDIGRALGFLFDNAIMYGRPDGLLTVSVDVVGEQVRIAFVDDGYGIPVAEQQLVFGRFFRATNASKGKNEGSGVSLYLAHTIIEQHQGSLTFTSVENEGSTFTVLLPLSLS